MNLSCAAFAEDDYFTVNTVEIGIACGQQASAADETIEHSS